MLSSSCFGYSLMDSINQCSSLVAAGEFHGPKMPVASMKSKCQSCVNQKIKLPDYSRTNLPHPLIHFDFQSQDAPITTEHSKKSNATISNAYKQIPSIIGQLTRRPMARCDQIWSSVSRCIRTYIHTNEKYRCGRFPLMGGEPRSARHLCFLNRLVLENLWVKEQIMSKNLDRYTCQPNLKIFGHFSLVMLPPRTAWPTVWSDCPCEAGDESHWVKFQGPTPRTETEGTPAAEKRIQAWAQINSHDFFGARVLGNVDPLTQMQLRTNPGPRMAIQSMEIPGTWKMDPPSIWVMQGYLGPDLSPVLSRSEFQWGNHPCLFSTFGSIGPDLSP